MQSVQRASNKVHAVLLLHICVRCRISSAAVGRPRRKRPFCSNSSVDNWSHLKCVASCFWCPLCLRTEGTEGYCLELSCHSKHQNIQNLEVWQLGSFSNLPVFESSDLRLSFAKSVAPATVGLVCVALGINTFPTDLTDTCSAHHSAASWHDQLQKILSKADWPLIS